MNIKTCSIKEYEMKKIKELSLDRFKFIHNYMKMNKDYIFPFYDKETKTYFVTDESGTIYIAENQFENVFLRIGIYKNEIVSLDFVTFFNHKKISNEYKDIDVYKSLKSSKRGYLSYEDYMSVNKIYENQRG